MKAVQFKLLFVWSLHLTPAVADVMAWVAASSASAVAVILNQSGEISSEEQCLVVLLQCTFLVEC